MKKIFLMVMGACLVPAMVWALPIAVSFDAQDTVVDVGDIFSVDLVADIAQADAVASWGLDLGFDAAVLGLVGGPAIGPSWNGPFMGWTPDNDGLAGFAPFVLPPQGVWGNDVVLATFTFQALGAGTSTLMVGSDGAPFEGFYLASWGQAEWDFTQGSVTVNPGGTAPVPEPGTMILLGSGLIGLAGTRRRARKG